MDNIVVFGASGQLGQCLKSVAETKGITSIYFPSESEADILNPDVLEQVFKTFERWRPYMFIRFHLQLVPLQRLKSLEFNHSID